MSSSADREAQLQAQLAADKELAKNLSDSLSKELPNNSEDGSEVASDDDGGSYSFKDPENSAMERKRGLLDLEDEIELRKEIFGESKPSVWALTIAIVRELKQEREKAKQLERVLLGRIAMLDKECLALRNTNNHLEQGLEKVLSELDEERRVTSTLNDRLTTLRESTAQIAERLKTGGTSVPVVEKDVPNLQTKRKAQEIYESFDELTEVEVEELINHLADVPSGGEEVWSKWNMKDHESKKLLKALNESDFISKYPASAKESHSLAEGYKFEIVIHSLKLGFFNFAEFDHLKKLINSIFKCQPLAPFKDYPAAISYLRRNYLMLTLRPRTVSDLGPFFERIRSLVPNLSEERKAKMAIKQMWPCPLKAFILSRWNAMTTVVEDETTIWESIEKNISKWTKDYSHADRQKFIKMYFKGDAQLRTEMEKKLMDQENTLNEKLQRERASAERTAKIEQARVEAEAKKAAEEKAKVEVKKTAPVLPTLPAGGKPADVPLKKKKKYGKGGGGGGDSKTADGPADPPPPAGSAKKSTTAIPRSSF